MNDERISEVETKLYTHEGRLKHTEQDMRQVVGNIDRIEEHLLNGSTKTNMMPIISGIVGLLGVMGTAVFGIMNYVDLQLRHVKDSHATIELRVTDHAGHIRDLGFIIHDRLGRLEERASTLEEDVDEINQ